MSNEDYSMAEQGQSGEELYERPHIIVEYQLQPPSRDEGGFINKKTGVHYINVAVQTDPKPKPPAPKKYTRDAQTVQMTDHVSQTYRESGTQMV